LTKWLKAESAWFVGEVVNEFVNDTGYLKGYVVVVEMNPIAYSWQHDRVSHVLIVSNSSGIVRVKFHVVMGVINVHFITASHRF
jgi:hypothetical protein